MASKNVLEKDKKYYWLKLKNDFFKRHDIRIIEGMPNGKDYVLFYLKLLVESVGHEGELRFSDTIPYNEEMLSTITNTNIDIVRSAVKIFRELDMMEFLEDGTIFMQEVNKMIGHESYYAIKQREHRERKEAEKALNSVKSLTLSNGCQSQSNLSREEIEIELDKELEKEEEEEEERSAASALKEIVRAYEQEIGMITPVIAGEIESFIKETTKEIIIRSIQEASMNNKRSWQYVKAVLGRCLKENVRTVADFERRKKQKDDQPKQQRSSWSEEQNGNKKKKNYDDIMMN